MEWNNTSEKGKLLAPNHWETKLDLQLGNC